MDHILENEGKIVPDVPAVTTSSGGPGTARGGDDEDDDAEALRAVYGATGSGNADAQAKVRLLLFLHYLWTIWSST